MEISHAHMDMPGDNGKSGKKLPISSPVTAVNWLER
jgi:hypothetical protein